MSYEVRALVKSDLPKADWTMVARITHYAGLPYGAHHAEFLHDALPALPRPRQTPLRGLHVSAVEGALYVGFEFGNADRDELLLHASKLLTDKSVSLITDDGEIRAVADASNLINPAMPIAESFNYMTHDITRELEATMSDTRYAQSLVPNTELEQLVYRH